MITLFTGSPGAGKTASLVDFLSKLPGDRPIFSDGLEGLTLPHTVVDSNNWHKELPDGAILVIDEVQRVWRPRGPGAKVPDSVAELETHRHRGIDVFITTQSPRLLDANVRALVGRHVHIRDTGILGRYWYEWPECNDAMAWKTCINKKRIKLPKKAFSLYKSASMHVAPVRGVPRALIYGFFAFVALAVLSFMTYKILTKHQTSQSLNSVSSNTESPHVLANSHTVTPIESKKSYIDDRVDFIPRVSNRPESAPAYDHLRKVVTMPVVVGGYCQGQKCHCVTQQGTHAGLSDSECRAWIERPPFDYYRAQPQPQPDRASPAEQGATPA